MRELIVPISPGERELIDYVLHFKSDVGFIEEYRKNYAKLSGTTRKRRGLATAAYEMTEQYYCRLLNLGRRFKDREEFFDAKSKLKRKQRRTDGNKS